MTISCERNIPEHSKLIDKYSQLIQESDRILMDVSGKGSIIKTNEWPNTIKQLSPEKVYYGEEGLYLMYKDRYVEEWGIFILLDNTDFIPEESGDPSYNIITNRIYNYHIAG